MWKCINILTSDLIIDDLWPEIFNSEFKIVDNCRLPNMFHKTYAECSMLPKYERFKLMLSVKSRKFKALVHYEGDS